MKSKEVIQELHTVSKGALKDLERYSKSFWKQRSNKIFTLCVFLALAGYGIFKAYSWYWDKEQRQAQEAFFESISLFNQTQMTDWQKDKTSSGEKANWDEVDLAFKTAYNRNSGSTIAPFFKAYESVAATNNDKLKEALITWKQSLDQLKPGPFFYLYSIKLALLDIAIGDPRLGIERLEALSNDKTNPFQDIALYYLGEYYWSKNETEKALKIFKQIVHGFKDSRWVALVKTRAES